MNSKLCLLSVIAAAGLAVPALAQDSTPKDGADRIRGDGPRSNDTADQCDNFVVDLTTISTSWKNGFYMAPLLKMSHVADAGFPNALPSANGLSTGSLTDVPTPMAMYAQWSGIGIGVNSNVDGDIHDAPNMVAGPEGTVQLGVAVAEFSGNYEGIVGGLINYDPAAPERLYVMRRNAMVNGPTPDVANSAFGFGSVDATGNVYARADAFGGLNGPDQVSGNNVLRVDILERACGQLNDVSGSGFSNTGDFIITGNATAHTVPSNLGAEVNSVAQYVGTNFATEYRHEDASGVLQTTTSHLLGTDSRGSYHVLPQVPGAFAGTNAVGVAGLLAKSAGGGGVTDSLNISAIDNDAAPVTGLLLTRPLGITDNDDGFSVPTVGDDEFDHYRSQAGFRGGPQVGLGVDADGNLLAAATVYQNGGGDTQDPFNYIAVSRTDAKGGTEWTLAAYICRDGSNNIFGKEILDGPDGERIGQLAPIFFVDDGLNGPSMSAPTVDSQGNIYFLSAFQFDSTGNFTTGLIRAVYNPDTFSYQLELVFSNGIEVFSENTQRNYKVIFLSILDSNSVSSGTVWANSATATRAFDTARGEALSPANPLSLGGIVIGANIIYDINNDGEFVSATGGQGDPNTPDQNQQVLLFLKGAGEGGGVECYPDCDGNGVVNAADVGCFLSRYFAVIGGGPSDDYVDCDGNGAVNAADVGCFLSEYFSQLGACP